MVSVQFAKDVDEPEGCLKNVYLINGDFSSLNEMCF